MSATPNNTLPPQWSENQDYIYSDEVSYAGIIYKCIQGYEIAHGGAHNPATDIDREWWMPLDIYIKDETVMHHKNYSGDENFWERDNIYIDTNGYLYLNNENTGINVKGQDGQTVISFDSLTPAQIEQIRGPQGYRGVQGPAGPEGPRGPEGYVTLTAEQIAILKGEQGKSAYQSWLDTGHTGTEEDFVNWIRTGVIQLDTELSTTSGNAVTNAAITNAFQAYRTQLNEIVHLCEARIQDLENRLKSTYQENDINFRFGVTPEGKYGYYISDTSTIVPFEGEGDEVLTSASAFRSDPQVFQNQIGQGNMLVNNTLVSTQLTDPTSLEGSVSGENDDSDVLYGNNVEFQNLAQAFDAYIYIFTNNNFTDNGLCSLYSMNFNNPPTPLLSANTESIEGIYFPPGTIDEQGSRLYIEVEPVNEGDTIRYQIGSYRDPAGQLPNLVDPGTYRYEYQNGSFDENVTIEYPLEYGEGYYFASLQRSEFRIKQIYIS